MQHIPTQSHYVRCPALDRLFNGLCGPLTKTFVDPCSITEWALSETRIKKMYYSYVRKYPLATPH